MLGVCLLFELTLALGGERGALNRLLAKVAALLGFAGAFKEV